MSSIQTPNHPIRFSDANLGKGLAIRAATPVLLVLALVGCRETSETSTASSEQATQTVSAVTKVDSSTLSPIDDNQTDQADSFVLLPLDWSQIQEQILAGTPERYTIVDFWSLSCAPCVKELPELARLSRDESDRFRCVGVSVDFNGRPSRPPEYYSPKIRDVLQQMDARFENVLCQTPDVDIFASLDIPSTPAVLILDSNGKEIRRFADGNGSTGFTYQDDVLPFLATLE